jgi:hypothetical protein
VNKQTSLTEYNDSLLNNKALLQIECAIIEKHLARTSLLKVDSFESNQN